MTNPSTLNVKHHIVYPVAAIFGLMMLMMSFFTVDEGHIGIVKRFSQAKYQVDPGLHFKIPFVDNVVEIEVRTRKNEEQMTSSTSEQMPITANISVNWTVDKAEAMQLYIKYGGLKQFESRILDPRFRSAAKDVLPEYTAEMLIQDRSAATSRVEEQLLEEMKDFPVSMDNVQIENIVLPAKYIESIQIKQTEKNLAAAEKHKLERQRLTAQQKVNTAEAQRDADKAIADGKAYAVEVAAMAEAKAIEMKGIAESKAIKAKAKQLRNNPLIIELTKAQQWNGSYLTTGLGRGTNSILVPTGPTDYIKR